MPAHPEITILNLDKRDRYPSGGALSYKFFFNEQHALMTRDTSVASIGSCFARVIKDYLVDRGFNYL